jgi:hypothetical protein
MSANIRCVSESCGFVGLPELDGLCAVHAVLRDKDAEIERLRAALAVFADDATWTAHSNRAWTKPGYPAAFARKVLEAK